jgi:hypothetical protein
MRIGRFLLSLGAAAIAAGLAIAGARGPRATISPALAAPSPASSGPAVALLVTRPAASHTSLYLQRPGDRDVGAPLATFSHLEGAAVRGAVVPGTDVVLAAADTAPTRDPSFAASLFRVAPHRPPEILCDRVVHSSRPLVTAAGRVFVSRGAPGPEVEGQMRVDALTIDEIDPATGAARPVHAASGYLLFLAGAHAHELLLYRVLPGGADLVAVDPDTGAARVVLAPMLPFARDFSIDAARGAIVFQQRDEHDSRTWTVERVDLASGARERLFAGPSTSLAPHVFPGGGIALSSNGRDGLALLGAARALSPLGAGVDVIQAVSPDGTWVAGAHTVAGRLPVAFAIDARAGAGSALPAPPDARVTVAGFVTAGGAR